jgi:hypothetical protein
MVLKLGHFGKEIRSTWNLLKWDAGEGWRRLVVQHQSCEKWSLQGKNILHTIKSRLTELLAPWVGTAF